MGFFRCPDDQPHEQGLASALAIDRHDDEDALAQRIAAARAAEPRARDGKSREESSAWSVAAEFVGAMLGGALIGWIIDRFAHTAPWGLIVFLVLGFAAGVRGVLRQQNKIDGK